MNEWKKIDENAPLDGTRVLGAIKSFRTRAGHFMEGEVAIISRIGDAWRKADNKFQFFPTHWMELPTPPKED